MSSGSGMVARLWLMGSLAVACAPDRALDGLPEARELDGARPTLTVDGLELALTASVERDAMPGMPYDERGIMVGARLNPVRTRSLQGLELRLPEGMAIKRLFVVSGDRVWVTEAQTLGRRLDDRIEVNGGEGPKWEPGQPVDVFAEVTMTRWPTVYLAARGERVEVVQ